MSLHAYTRNHSTCQFLSTPFRVKGYKYMFFHAESEMLNA
jgi:hypothetical protein